MAMVGDQDFQTMLLSNHPSLMDWNMGHAEHSSGLSRGMSHQGEEIPTYAEHFSQAQLTYSNSPMSHFDMSDNYHAPKVEPLTGSEYEYYPPSQVGPSGHYHVGSGGTSFVSHLPVTDAFDNHPSPVQPQHGGGGALEEIDGLLSKFPEVPQQPHQDLEPFDIRFPHTMYGSTSGGQSSSLRPMSHVSGLLGGGGLSSQHSRNQWIPDPQPVLVPKEMLAESSLETSQGLGPENSVYMGRETRMGNFYSDVPRAQLGASSSNWAIGSSLKPSGHLPTTTQLPFHQMVLKPTQQQQQQHSKHRLNTSGLGGSGFSQSDHNAFLRPVSGFVPGNPPISLPLHQLHISQLPGGNGLLNPLAEQIVPQSPVPATGLELVHLLLACAEAFAENKLSEAEVILARLRSHVLPGGNPMQRLAAYFEQALTARLTKENSSPIFKGFTGDRSLPQAELLEAFSVYYDCIPIGKFGHLTCNQILLDAVEREKAIHVLDLHIWHGMQWPAFLQALALRPGGPPKLRISAVGSDLSDLKETGEKLQECAETLKVSFEYCPILTTLEDFSSKMVETRRGESLLINSFVQFHRILNKSPNSLGKLLSDLRLLNPKVLAFAENDGNHNHQSFLTRFVECLRYYSAVFDAFDASLPPDSPERMKMEQIFAAQKIRNIIACEGPDRVDGHETMKYWHKRLEGAQFRCVPLSHRAVSQANLLLNLYYSSGYTLNTSDCGYLMLGWHGMPLTGVSAWC